MKGMFISKLFWLKRWKISGVDLNINQWRLLASSKKRLLDSASYWQERGLVRRNGDILVVSRELDNFVFKRFPVWKMLDRKWTHELLFLIFDVPSSQNKNRFFIRRVLLNYRFGLFQRSVFVSPFVEFMPELTMMMRRRMGDCSNHSVLLFSVPDKELVIKVRRIWKVNDLRRKYNGILQKRARSLSQIRGIFEDFIRLKQTDPCLPGEINPFYREFLRAEEKIRELVASCGRG
jgi:hypothetical protein